MACVHAFFLTLKLIFNTIKIPFFDFQKILKCSAFRRLITDNLVFDLTQKTNFVVLLWSHEIPRSEI